jgi:hypothetical protein
MKFLLIFMAITIAFDVIWLGMNAQVTSISYYRSTGIQIH